MVLLDSLYTRLEFCKAAVQEEIKQSRWYKAMSIVSPLYVIFGLVVTFSNPIPSWSWTTRIIILQSSFLLVLVMVVEAVYRTAKRSESARPVIDVLVPAAFVRPVYNNRSICQVFIQVELQNKTPHRANLTKYLLDFKVKGKTAVRLNKLLSLEGFQVCNTIEAFDEECGEISITLTDCEDIDDLRTVVRTDGPPTEGFPTMGWLGFIVRKSVLPYESYEERTGRSMTILDDDGVPDEIEETETVYVPQFSQIEEIKLTIVDGHQQSWSGIAASINPKGEAVTPPLKAVA